MDEILISEILTWLEGQDSLQWENTEGLRNQKEFKTQFNAPDKALTNLFLSVGRAEDSVKDEDWSPIRAATLTLIHKKIRTDYRSTEPDVTRRITRLLDSIEERGDLIRSRKNLSEALPGFKKSS